MQRDAERSAAPTPRERVDDAVALVRAVARQTDEREVTFLAAAVTYYAFVSLVPLALLAVAVGSVVGGPALAEGVAAGFGEALTPEGERVLETALAAEEGRGGATLLGVGVLLWSGLKLFRGLDRAFSQVYGSTTGSLPNQLSDAAVVLGAVGLGVGSVALLGALVGALGLPLVASVAGAAAVWPALVAAFLPLYYVFPDSGVGLRERLPGAVVAAASFTALGTLFGVYASMADGYALYGLLGAVLLVLTWLYLASVAVMVGAVLNAVVAGRIGEWR